MDYQQEEQGDVNIHEARDTKILLRMASIGNFTNKYTFPAALNATIISSDGRPLPEAIVSDTLWTFPGERYQVLCNPITEFIDSIKVDYHHLGMGPARGTQYINVVVDGVYGIDPIEPIEQIDLYPNPSTENIQFTVSNFDYSIFSISGELIREAYSNDGYVGTSELPNSVYLIRIKTNETFRTFYFIKE